MTDETTTLEIYDLENELRHFTGDIVRFRHHLNQRVLYTPGVRHLVERAEAWWLVDAIASWINSSEFKKSAQEDGRIGEMHFWQLEVDIEGMTGKLDARIDSGIEPFIVQTIPYTDFPLENVSIWAAFDGRFWTLYLPSEH